tara:strand:+ start:44781 stop:45458 length:678 start_codon:yes stop_codon:yes gene_type:complete
MSQQFLQETMPFTVLRKERIFSESRGKKVSVLTIGGQFQRADKPNANGRIYPREVLGEAVSRAQDAIRARGVLGEYDHPPDAKIHLDRVSHLITKLWMEGDVVFGEAEILENTILGAQLKALIEHDVQIGISSRGVGDMETTMFENEEYYQVLPGYSFVTFDMVAEPSVHGSYMSVLNSPSSRSGVRLSVAESVERRPKSIIKTKTDQEKLIVVETRDLLKDLLR